MAKAICQSCGFGLPTAAEMGTTAGMGVQPLVCLNCMKKGGMDAMLRVLPLPIFIPMYRWALKKGLHPEKGKVVSKAEMDHYVSILASLPWWTGKGEVKKMRAKPGSATLTCQACGNSMSEISHLGTDVNGKLFPLLCHACFAHGEFNDLIKGSKTVEEYATKKREQLLKEGKTEEEVKRITDRYPTLLYWIQLPH